MKVAVCIASYQSDDFLKELQTDLDAQTFRGGFRTFVVKNVSPAGLAKRDAVNLALHSNPEYICMIDSDDLVAATYLQRVVERLDRGDIDWCFTWGRLFGERKGFIHGEIEPFPTATEASYENTGLNHRPSWISAKADVFRTVNYDPTLQGIEDWALWLELDRRGFEGDVIREELYFRRWHTGNLTSTSFRELRQK